MSPRAETDIEHVWRLLVDLVMDSRDGWRKQVTEITGLPFSRVRALKRLVDGPRTLRELAAAMDTDAPAATVAVNDLEERGLVVRETDPDDRRVKRVVLTTEGRRVYALLRKVKDTPPAALAAINSKDAATLRKILTRGE